jgi:hypothetical protein
MSKSTEAVSPDRSVAAPASILVSPGADGRWTVNERGPGKDALSYFQTKWSAVRHAIEVARHTAPPCEVRVAAEDGGSAIAHLFLRDGAEHRVPAH